MPGGAVGTTDTPIVLAPIRRRSLRNVVAEADHDWYFRELHECRQRHADALEPYGRNDGLGFLMTAGRVVVQARAARTRAVPPQQGRRHPTLVEKRMLTGIVHGHPQGGLPVALTDRNPCCVNRWLENPERGYRFGYSQRTSRTISPTISPGIPRKPVWIP